MVVNEDLSSLEVTQELDCRGELCPLPVYKTSVALSRLQDGDVLRLLCTDPGARADIPALASQAGHGYLGHQEQDDADVFYLRKGGGA